MVEFHFRAICSQPGKREGNTQFRTVTIKVSKRDELRAGIVGGSGRQRRPNSVTEKLFSNLNVDNAAQKVIDFVHENTDWKK